MIDLKTLFKYFVTDVYVCNDNLLFRGHVASLPASCNCRSLFSASSAVSNWVFGHKRRQPNVNCVTWKCNLKSYILLHCAASPHVLYHLLHPPDMSASPSPSLLQLILPSLMLREQQKSSRQRWQVTLWMKGPPLQWLSQCSAEKWKNQWKKGFRWRGIKRVRKERRWRCEVKWWRVALRAWSL